jgi:hypothetical protein
MFVFGLTQKEPKKSRLTNKNEPDIRFAKFGRMISEASSELSGLSKAQLLSEPFLFEGRFLVCVLESAVKSLAQKVAFSKLSEMCSLDLSENGKLRRIEQITQPNLRTNKHE